MTKKISYVRMTEEDFDDLGDSLIKIHEHFQRIETILENAEVLRLLKKGEKS